MPKKVEYRGLCLTCNNAAACASSRDSDKPVFHCEGFDDYEHSPPKVLAKQDSLHDAFATDRGSTRALDADNFMGLCKNCDERDSCKLTEPEGGVWHCEEYR